MSFCGCSGQPGNTGQPEGIKPFGITRMLLVQKQRTNGVRNGIPAGTTYDQAWIDGLLNASDDTKIYPIKDLESVTSVREASTFETFPSGKNVRIRQGVKPFSAFIPGAVPEFLEKLNSAGCSDLQVYRVDQCGNIQGVLSSDGTTLYGIKLEKDTLDNILKEYTDTESGGITYAFQFDKDELDERLRMLPSSAISIDVLDVNGLVDLVSTVGTINTTDVTVQIDTCYGYDAGVIHYEGAALADFVLTNNTTPGPVVISALTENAPGNYTFTFAAQTAADNMEITLAPSVAGYDLASTTFVAV